MQQARLPLVSHSHCNKKYGTVDRRAHLCAGEGRAAASGGYGGSEVTSRKPDTFLLAAIFAASFTASLILLRLLLRLLLRV